MFKKSNRISLINYPRKYPAKIKIFGLVTDIKFQEVKYIVKMIYTKDKTKRFFEPYSRGMLEFDWMEFVSGLCKDIGSRAYQRSAEFALFWNENYIDDKEFIMLVKDFSFMSPAPYDLIKLADEEYKSYFTKNPYRSYVSFDINYQQNLRHLVFELYSDLLPETCEYFMRLCMHHPMKENNLSYVGTFLHRVAEGGWIQGGTLNTKYKTVPDESYAVSHNRRGVLLLCNNGTTSSESQFIISLGPSHWMFGYYVAIGQLIEGYTALEELEFCEKTYECPDTAMIVQNCSVLPYGQGICMRDEFINRIVKEIKNKWKKFALAVSAKKQRGSAISIHSDELYKSLRNQPTDSNVLNTIESVIKSASDRPTESTLTQYLMALLLDVVMSAINQYRVQEDIIDVRDASSEVLLLERYLQDLYSNSLDDDSHIVELLDIFIQQNLIQEAREIKMDLIKRGFISPCMMKMEESTTEEQNEFHESKHSRSCENFETHSFEITEEIKVDLTKSISNIVNEGIAYVRATDVNRSLKNKRKTRKCEMMENIINELLLKIPGYSKINTISNPIMEEHFRSITLHFVKSVVEEAVCIYREILNGKAVQYKK